MSWCSHSASKSVVIDALLNLHQLVVNCLWPVTLNVLATRALNLPLMMQDRLKAQELKLFKLHSTQGSQQVELSDAPFRAENPNSLSDFKRPELTDGMDLAQIVRACEDVCSNLQNAIQSNILDVTTDTLATRFNTTSTVNVSSVSDSAQFSKTLFKNS